MAARSATALITGSSSGIGLELSRLFTKDRIDLALAARSARKLADVAADLTRPEAAAHACRAFLRGQTPAIFGVRNQLGIIRRLHERADA